MSCYGCIKPCADSFDNYGCEDKVLKAQSKETLDRNKSEELFYEIRRIETLVNHLGAYVQNPDFVNKDNVYQDSNSFDNEFVRIIKRLENVRTELFKLYAEILD